MEPNTLYIQLDGTACQFVGFEQQLINGQNCIALCGISGESEVITLAALKTALGVS